MHTIKNYVMAQSVEQAWELNQKGRNNVIIGGNMWLKMGKRNIVNAIDLSVLGLDQIEEDDKGFRIGCMVSLHQIETHEQLNRTFGGIFEEAVAHIVGVQFRNCATVGGSIFPRFGFSDVLTAFLACDTDVILHKGGVIPLRRFVTMVPDSDILTHLYVKKDRRKVAYESFRMTETDFPVLTCAVAKKGNEFETVIGARPKHAEAVTGISLSQPSSSEERHYYAQKVVKNLEYGSNIRGSAQYREELSKVLICRCLSRITEE
ncbi:MAG: FAD binding domain-containing protein [Eubacterium sp.]|nr:FAD binding domain-containing protein [Eubacterium sp.]MDD7210423.1 FAD binding domain-containing protein [Lachnospiraceae bacterium]MDY5498009.1 FAD binding domain-containing protein [Anaerobutyricum sp.]